MGGIYLLYLGVRLLFALRRPVATLQASEHAARQSFFMAAGVNILNSGPYIFWTLVGGPIMLAGMEESLFTGLSFVAGFYLVFVASLLAIIWIFTTIGRLDPRVNRAMIVVSGIAMLLIGVYQIIISGRALLN